MNTQPQISPVVIHTTVYWIFILIYLVVLVTIPVATTIFTDAGIERFGLTWSWSGFATIAAFLHLVASIKTRPVDEHAGITIFDMPVFEMKYAGPFLAPLLPGIIKVVRLTRNVLQRQFPGEPEQIEWRDEKDVLTELRGGQLPEGKVWPIRVPTGPAREGVRSDGIHWSKDDPFNVQMVISAAFYVQYYVKDLFQFLSVVGGNSEEDALARLEKRLRDTGERVLLEEYSSRNLALIIEDITKISEKMRDACDVLTRMWGVDITEVGTLMPNPGHEFNISVRGIAQKKAEAHQTRITADAVEYELTHQGMGRGNANEHEIAGRIRGLTEASKAGIDPVVIIAATVAQDVAKNAKYSYFGELGGLGGITDAIAKTLKEGVTPSQKLTPTNTGDESQ